MSIYNHKKEGVFEMKNLLTTALLFTGLIYGGSIVQAQTAPTGCPKGLQRASVNLTVSFSPRTDGSCPLLQDKQLRNLVNKYAVDKVFAYPAVPCVSSTNPVTGTITVDGITYPVTGASQSGQVISGALAAVDPNNAGVLLTGLSSSNAPFATGVAMTVLTLTANNKNLRFVSNDRFAINPVELTDYEEFDLIALDGGSVVGQLTGTGQINGDPFGNFEAEMTVTGTPCVKLP
ncbi:hypothetical protein [Methylomonas rapida]|uniref:Secreted protein n=1 Tax=Methylomonas rapida TaxID=2963939 RepID=A0ABY7GN13_9GAMM|nr:hypothetical protein [Methylomonas rapida]WAR45894.1 hypothetical protein NM686_005090 [Methylomonas rapida]